MLPWDMCVLSLNSCRAAGPAKYHQSLQDVHMQTTRLSVVGSTDTMGSEPTHFGGVSKGQSEVVSPDCPGFAPDSSAC
jgi:hypothetical protein